MFLDNQRARPVRYVQKKYAGTAQPEEPRVVDDDPLRALAAARSSSIHVRAFKYGTDYPDGQREAAICIASRWRISAIRSTVAVLRPEHDRRRVPPLARRVERLPVARRRPPAVDPARPGRRQGPRGAHRRRVHRDRAVGALRRGAACEPSTLDAKVPAGPMRGEVGPAQVRDEAGQPGQQAQVHDHRRRHRAGGRVGGGLARRARLQRPRASASRTARAARTASPPRAASTRPRITRTTATASTASSTTRSRAAITARAKRTSTASPS